MAWQVHARGELQLGVLLEALRREGFEVCVSPPRVLTTVDENGKTVEPYEEVTVDVDLDLAGTVIERIQRLKAPMTDYKEVGDRVRLVFEVRGEE